MTELSDLFEDRTGWPAGPWDNELDRYEWRSPSGMPCLMSRGGLGAWCGYVGVPPGHPWYGKGTEEFEAHAHGGVNYASECAGSICHAAQPGEPEPWWIGFDTCHGDDMPPGLLATVRELMESAPYLYRRSGYRDAAYTRAEVEHLAEQAEAASRAP